MKGVIFDMDGLMFDTETVADDAWVKAGKQLGVNITLETMSLIHGLQPESFIPILERELGDSFDYDKTRKLQLEIMWDYLDTYGVPAKPGLYELLHYLKANGYKTAIASSSAALPVSKGLNSTGVRKYIDIVITGDMIKRGKPEPDIFLKACSEMGLVPSDCLVLEDSPYGILAAERAGMKSIMIPDAVKPTETEKERTVCILSSLDKVIDVLETGI